MSLPLTLFLVAVLVPAFFGKLRSTPVWLSLQALALAWNVLTQHMDVSDHALTSVLELVLVRAVLVPLLLRRMTRALAGESEGPGPDLIAPNLFAWAISAVLIVLAFELVGVASLRGENFTLGVMAATVVTALLILSTNLASPAQLVAVLFLENAVVLFESLLPHPWPLPVHMALTAVYVGTVVVGISLVRRPLPPADADSAEYREVL